jgi:hypothetical protein
MSSATSGGITRVWILLTNAAMMLAWGRVLGVLCFNDMSTIIDPKLADCSEKVTSSVTVALGVSFLELFNAVIGVTRSKPQQVLLFSVIRMGVELIVTPAMNGTCSAWQHILTVACWSLGDTVRFSCFLLDNLFPGGRLAKSVRYTVGPILFPMGTIGEMLMVIAVGNQTEATVMKLLIYGAASLWPVGFYFLFTQLLRQRKKFFGRDKRKTAQKVKV